jgi:hypothetical protein
VGLGFWGVFAGLLALNDVLAELDDHLDIDVFEFVAQIIEDTFGLVIVLHPWQIYAADFVHKSNCLAPLVASRKRKEPRLDLFMMGV